MAEINKLDINGYTMESIYAKIGISYDRFVELLDRDFYTPTLTAAPTASTLTYTDTDGSVCEFRIGQFCRVADSTVDGGYKIYQCVDIKSGVSGTFVSWQSDIAALKQYVDDALALRNVSMEDVDDVEYADDPITNDYVTETTLAAKGFITQSELDRQLGDINDILDEINGEEV